MSVLKLATPGVYVQEVPSLPPSVAEVETAIPAFIGYTEKAQQNEAGDLVNTANKITSMADFVVFYGGPPKESNNSVDINVEDLGSNQYKIDVVMDESKLSKFNLYYSVRHFYDNGGGVCYIVSTGGYKNLSKDDLITGLGIVKDVDEVTLLIIPEAAKLSPKPTQSSGSWDQSGYKEVVNAMIKQASDTGDRFALIDPIAATLKNATDPNGDIDGDTNAIREATLSPAQNSFAAAYYPNLVTTYALTYDFENLVIKLIPSGGVVDTEATEDTEDTEDTEGTESTKLKENERTMSDVGKGSLLYNKIEAEMQKQHVVLPPSGAIAGLYSRVDSTKGVWKAPANESLLSVVKPNVNISSREQQGMNIDANSGKSINAVRSFPGFGTLVWGARTLNGNDNEWKYISVRRFFNMVEESIRKSSHWAVFEPNTISTWVKMQAMIENYLYQKWRDGALAGAKPDQAYYVRVGLGSTMTSSDILEGRMNVEIGMAVSRPAEFIVLKFTQLMQQS